jgi:2-C-methyl-D-erythritol 4-phosphate cytidylyltransferase
MSLSSIWAVVPAAGIGKRMETNIPKQYLTLTGSTVLEHTLNRLLTAKQICGLVVALNDDDEYWDSVRLHSEKPVLKCNGGSLRCNSVLNALETLSQYDDFDDKRDWVLVHDAVRPCVSLNDITALIEGVGSNESGGLLAIPVSDTVKRQADDQTVLATVERKDLWRALTPQFFPYGILKEALQKAVKDDVEVTDESSAMEYMGYKPLLIQGSVSNIKITRPGDLRLAEMYLAELNSEEAM